MHTSTADNKPLIELVKVSKVYPPDVLALEDVSLQVLRGEILFLTGMSGAGKTTLLKLICSIETPTKGLIEVAGRDLSKIKPAGIQLMRQKIGVAYQDFKLINKLTVMQNIAMAMEVTYKSKGEIKKRIMELLDTLKLTDKVNKPAGELSRGEQQRVALARAAANSPTLLLADEPTGNLDPAATDLVVKLFKQLNESGSTIVIATHDEKIYEETDYRVMDLHYGHISTHTGKNKPRQIDLFESHRA
ncbi:MAG: cell division ATP-binding protein FtsE [Desulfobulbaceae bacterium]|nr:cell division ATP-binding protein FtsE [Desulfobulbaceae bacterium]HIJ78898.1 cell division ATP-binding protein FtsE [Deltaproteobacteria bacterium]